MFYTGIFFSFIYLHIKHCSRILITYMFYEYTILLNIKIKRMEAHETPKTFFAVLYHYFIF